MKYFSHLNTATGIILDYRGEEPLHLFLKRFFSQHTKFGSKDRKRISQLCYVFYRTARAFGNDSLIKEAGKIHEIIVAGLFLCTNMYDELLAIMKPEWNEKIHLSLPEKRNLMLEDVTVATPEFQQLFPLVHELSDEIDKEKFPLSHLQQPDLFIRIRPGYYEAIIQKLEEQEAEFEFIPPFTIRLPNGFKVDEIFEIDKEVVVQDLNSQRVGGFLQLATARIMIPGDALPSEQDKNSLITSLWDCCAASGGKSILAQDILGNIDLTVSDLREPILANLKKRFKVAGINRYKSFVADLSTTSRPLPIANYDIILADLPCTGSGTWSRTPEQLYFFDASSIEKYSQLQKRIVVNIIPQLKEDGKLLYVTCSVFKKENEDIIQFITEKFPLKIDKMELFKGYDVKADTMFAAILSPL